MTGQESKPDTKFSWAGSDGGIRYRILLLLAWTMTGLTLIFGAGSASASKQAIAYFGTDVKSHIGTLGGEFTGPGDVAVNNSGVGPADAGDIYAIDSANNRIQRFSQDNNGTPGDPYDDTYPFVSAWGAGVDSSVAGDAYEICTVAAHCTKGIPNGTGALQLPEGIAVDQDTGNVYVSDTYNNRISLYEGDGTFLRSFGWDVAQSGSGDTGTGHEVCVVANGDTCKAGVGGNGVGQLGNASARGIAISPPDGNATSGMVYVADGWNHRVNTYDLDGGSPASFGSPANFPPYDPRPGDVAVDSRGIVYATDYENSGEIERYDSLNANGNGVGFLAPIAAQAVRVSGGPGSVLGSTPYEFTFMGPLGRSDVGQLSVSNGTTPLSGGAGASVTTTAQGGPGTDEVQKLTVAATAGQFRLTFEGQTTPNLPFDASRIKIQDFLEELSSVPSAPLVAAENVGVEIDPDSDGPGPDTDVLYVLRDGYREGQVASEAMETLAQQFGPLNAPGLVVPPGSQDDAHGTVAGFHFVNGLGLDVLSGRLFVSTSFNIGGEWTGGADDKSGVYVLDTAGSPPSATLDSVGDVTERSATIHATVEPNGGPPVGYRLEYSLDGTNWKSTPETLVGVQETPVPITAVLDPPPFGLDPGTLYHVRVKVTKAFTPSLTTSELTFTTSTVPPAVETTGSPIRTTSSAKLGGRVTPRGFATTYFFEYGDQGPCGSNPCTQTSARSAGSGQLTQLVSEEIAELQPDTTYHYRLVADNGQAGSPAFGEDMTVTTRSGEAPLSHGRLPGPPGSDRAWELVSAPDSGGNPVAEGDTISDNGTRAVWELSGGSPLSETGGFNQFYSERTASGWQVKKVYPARSELPGPNWHAPIGPSDLSSFVALNLDFTGGGISLFRMSPGSPPLKLLERPSLGEYGFFEVASDDGSRVLMRTSATDPEHPVPPGTVNLFDVTSGTPHLVNFLPGNEISKCGFGGSDQPYTMSSASRGDRWVSANGELAFFLGRDSSCTGISELYVRDFEAAETKLLSGPPLSGPACGSNLIKSTPDAAFFWTKNRLAAEDTLPASCSDESADGDVYRYDLGTDSLRCVTCVAPGVDADVVIGHNNPASRIAIADDGSRVYFESPKALLAGARAPAVYRVDVESGDLAYLGATGKEKIGIPTTAMTPDGSVVLFSSDDPSLNPLGGGAGNAGTRQFYRYDDNDRSLVCVSCPRDGGAPRGAAQGFASEGQSPNTSSMSADGILAFATPTALVGADQNTAGVGQDPGRGTDIYEWRDGRLFLVTDGLTDWRGSGSPTVRGITPSGRDLIFTAATQYTADALDDFTRLYDARIGGGIEFPKPPPPCPLEVCQGTPKGVPEEAAPGTGSFAGPGNAAQRKPARCPAGKRKTRHAGKTRCVSKKQYAKNKANRNRRTAR